MSNNPFTISGDVSLGLEGKYRTNWVENGLELDDTAATPHLGSSHTKTFIGGSMTRSRMTGLLVAAFIGLVIILVRTFYLQGMRGNYYFALAENNRLRQEPIIAERGIIYDRFGAMLVQNIPSFSLAIIPQDLPRTVISGKTVIDPSIIDRIATLSSVSSTAIQALLKRYGTTVYEPLVIKELGYDDAIKIYTNNDIPGFALESGSERFYQTSSTKAVSSTVSLSPILGYVGKIEDENVPAGYLKTDVIGKTGVEKTYEAALRGSYGSEQIEVNAVGKEQKVLSVSPPTPGKNLTLTIDAAAQAKLQSLVEQTAQTTGHRSISAIAMDPRNGEIIAMVSWPSYDNNLFSGGIDQKSYDTYLNDKDHPLLNRAIAGEFAPGSTFKLIMATAGLQEKVITPYTTVDSVGGVQLGDRLFRDWKVGGSGITNVTKALAWSVNTFFFYVGGGYKDFQGLGVDKIDQYMQLFGLGKQTGIDLPGEHTGFIPTKQTKLQRTGQDWFQGDTYNLSIGQGDLLVTPLQDAVWTAAIANGGTLITPHVGLKVTDSASSTTVLQFPSHKIPGIDAANIDVVQQGLRDCVTYGACKLLQDLPFNAAGKTGTAQIGDTSHAWFTSYAPYENPQIVVTVMVEKGGEGSTVAMPVANQFLAWWGQKYLHK